jgi:hypothetical protein
MYSSVQVLAADWRVQECTVRYRYSLRTGGSRNVQFGTGTRCGLEGPGIESRCRRDFPHPWIGPGAHSAFYTMGTVSFPEVKHPGRGVDHPSPSCAEVKETVELYLYAPSGASWLF